MAFKVISEPQEWWPSPAKLNLFLHITGRNSQGYHLLQSLFQIVDIGDQIAFNVKASSDISLITDLPGVPSESNLIVRAARSLQSYSNCSKGCDIWLNKFLPMGGGIGGGSSNAATTLVALNHLWDTGLSIDELAKLGLALGADVPIFVRGQTAFAEGVGEIITPVLVPIKTYLIVFPNLHVSTAAVFTDPKLSRNSKKIEWKNYLFDNTRNDCQKLVCNRYPKVANLLRQLLEYAPSRMTGTGACLFAVFDNTMDAEKALMHLPGDCHGFIANGVDQSPLHDFLINKMTI